ncbi:hypothetical protein [Thermomonospora umbrina]|uniref:Uncharacterized protein n=1 Tax=Thermomonospora umbrina TaxID=111806 RepID=A0A3D9ST87_9ACTN|nr:hypothetical protein [Thermomonospora umbrina]REE94911.1 hypothetical protein DFJ69_0280 [Thermomonospora umbrina]
MALSGRVKIALAGAGLAAAGVVAAAGTALAATDPDGARTELRIVEHVDPATVGAGSWTDEDCPHKRSPSPAPSAETADTR